MEHLNEGKNLGNIQELSIVFSHTIDFLRGCEIYAVASVHPNYTCTKSCAA